VRWYPRPSDLQVSDPKHGGRTAPAASTLDVSNLSRAPNLCTVAALHRGLMFPEKLKGSKKVAARTPPVSDGTFENLRKLSSTQGATIKMRSNKAKRLAYKISGPQRKRILQQYVAGSSIRAISRTEGRDRGTVTRIVRSADLHANMHQIRGRHSELGKIAIDGLHWALENGTNGRLALKILRNLGVIPILKNSGKT
jgi:hypothetical protein